MDGLRLKLANLLLSPSVLSSAEYDDMHPQLGFNTFRSSPDNSGNRVKRGPLPLKFLPPHLERYSNYWNNEAQSILQTQLHKNRLNKRKAKNAILFIGDGMSIPTLTATRVYMGGENSQLSFEQFPYTGLSKVRCHAMRRDSIGRLTLIKAPPPPPLIRRPTVPTPKWPILPAQPPRISPG